MLHVFLDFGHVDLEILVSLELSLHCNYVLSVANLAVMDRLEVFLELVKLGAQLFPLRLDTSQTLLGVGVRSNGKFTLDFL